MLDRAAVGEVAEDIERIGRSNLDIDVLDDGVLASREEKPRFWVARLSCPRWRSAVNQIM